MQTMHRNRKALPAHLATPIATLILAAAGSITLPLPALAQSDQPAATQPGQPTQSGRTTPGARPSKATPPEGRTLPEEDPGNTGPTININFAGGTLAAYVQAVRDAATKAGQPVNIVVPKEAEDETVPAISLVNVTPKTALESLTYAFPEQAGTAVSARFIGSPNEQSLTFALRYAKVGRVLLPGQPNMAMSPPQPPRFSRVHSLRTLVESPEGLPPDPSLTMPVENVLGALRAAAELETSANAPEGKIDPPEFLLHKESQLLICRGTQSQQDLVASLLSELRATLQPKRDRAYESAKLSATMKMQEVTLEAQLEQQKNMLKRCDAEVKIAKENLERAETLHQSGTMSVAEVNVARSGLNQAESNVERAQSDVRAAQAQLEVLRAQVNTRGGEGPPGVGAPSPAAAALGVAGPSVKLVYEVKDLEPLHKDLYTFCKLAVPGNWDEVGPYDQEEAYRYAPKDPNRQKYAARYWVMEMWKRTGKMPMIATRQQHMVIAQYLTTVRRAKANEPDLPGLDVDQMIQKGEDR
ncbi:MAG: TolC family protein [Phycisphaerales bacterium]|nr:TolC family protein [Phycisphaerales bacterium]